MAHSISTAAVVSVLEVPMTIRPYPLIRRACAWCQKPLDRLGPLQPDDRITHGICKPCFTKELARMNLLIHGKPTKPAAT
jgi:hypothetical protein